MPWIGRSQCDKQTKQTKDTKQTRGKSHNGLAIYIKKYINAKRRLMETQIFHNTKI